MSNVNTEHLAKLTRLELKEEEARIVPEQIEAILTYIGKLSDVDTSQVPESVYVTDALNIWREDKVISCEESIRQQCIEAFPKRLGDILEVQGVFQNRDEDI